MLVPTRFSEARSRLFDEAVEELRPVLVRRGARQEAVLVSREDLDALLQTFTDGLILRTRVGRVLHRQIPGHLWERILKHQLQIPEEGFWRKIR